MTPLACPAIFPWSSEKGERVRGLIVLVCASKKNNPLLILAGQLLVQMLGDDRRKCILDLLKLAMQKAHTMIFIHI